MVRTQIQIPMNPIKYIFYYIPSEFVRLLVFKF